MSHDTPSRTVRLHGLHRGADVSGEVELAVEERGIRLALAGGPALPVSWDVLDGVAHGGRTLTLYLMGDDVLELDDVDDAESLARTVAERACRLGEMTLGLRALGSVRANPGSEHQRFYGPLLAARRALEGARTPEAQWRAVDPEALADALRATLAAFATERFPAAPADRRALEAELEDYAEGLFASLERLGAARDAARAAPPDTRFAWWRHWAAELRVVFAEHDRAWMAALPALCDSRGQQGRLWRRILRFGRGAGVVLALLLGGTGLGAQGDAGPRETVRVRGAAADSLRARGFDVVGVHDGTPFVVVGPAERARLLALGVAVEPVRAARLRAQVAASVFRPYDDPARGVRAWLDSLARANPGRVALDTLGRTVEDRAIVAVKVGAADDAASRANVVFLATYHAREWIATEVARRLVRHLVLAPDARTRALVEGRDVWVVPVVNPDGYEYSHAVDRLWRKNRRPVGQFAGVDLNRNHAERWGLDELGSSSLPQSETYRGPGPASEPEVQAVQGMWARLRPVVGVSYHSFGDLLLYAPGFAHGLLPQDLGVLRALAGTDLQPAIRDRVAGSTQDRYDPGPGWQLYRTNGDFTDWAAAQGTLAFTLELTSGCLRDCLDGWYGFEFPDDEALVEQVFQDNLPFALDAMEAAADPARWLSPTTGLGVPRIAIESATPVVRVRVPRDAAALATVRVARNGPPSPVAMRRDTVDSDTWESRLVSEPLSRPTTVALTGPGLAATWTVLAAAGAEPADAGWDLGGWSAASRLAPVAGRAYWESTGAVSLRSPELTVPGSADTVTIAWWQQHGGNALASRPAGEVRVRLDGGAEVPVALVQGVADAWYPETATIAGVAGRRLQVVFAGQGLPWRVDEVAVLAHGLSTANGGAPQPVAIAPSENPVRGASVRFAWPADAGAGELAAYDFAGRRVWRRAVAAGEGDVRWDVAAEGIANGAYVIVSTAGGRTRKAVLYVAR